MYSPLWKITHQKPLVLCTPPFERSPIKSHRFCVLPPLKNHPSKTVGFVYSPLWKITVFGGPLFRMGPYFGKYGVWSFLVEIFAVCFLSEFKLEIKTRIDEYFKLNVRHHRFQSFFSCEFQWARACWEVSLCTSICASCKRHPVGITLWLGIQCSGSLLLWLVKSSRTPPISPLTADYNGWKTAGAVLT